MIIAVNLKEKTKQKNKNENKNKIKIHSRMMMATKNWIIKKKENKKRNKTCAL